MECDAWFKVIYTLGTSNRTQGEFMGLLREVRAELVCDVRSFPSSSRYPHFDKENLESALAAGGFRYVWLGRELGGYRKGGYLAYMDTDEFREGLEELERLATTRLTVLICAERFPWKCHRRFISAALEERGWDVIHIIDSERFWCGPKTSRGLKDEPKLFD